MAVAAVAIGGQLDADRRLLAYNTYEEYLDSLVTNVDLCYLQSTDTARTIAELGYRSSGETLSWDEFNSRRKAVMLALCPSRKPYEQCSEHLQLEDPLLQELALRERPNRVGLLSTIIFVCHFTGRGHEVSGYIDFEHRLVSEDWRPVFEGKKRIRPRTTDLGYYNWKTTRSFCNSSPNFKAIVDPIRGLLFQNRRDRKVICVDPNVGNIANNTTRIRVFTDKYKNVIVYDHVVRRKC